MVEYRNDTIGMFIESEKNLTAKSTLKNWKSALGHFDDFLHNQDLELDDIGEKEMKLFSSKLAGKVSDMTASQYLTAVKKLYNYHIPTESDRTNPIQYIDRGKMFDLESQRHDKRTLSQSEVRELVDSTDNMRAKTLLSLMASSGLRVQEACKAKISRLDLDNRCVDVMTVKNDFGRRDAYFDRKTRRLISQLTSDAYRMEYTGTDSDYIFLSKNTNQYDTETYLSVDRARDDFRTAVENSSIEPRVEQYSDGRERWNLTTHALRRSFCQYWIDKDGDLMSLANQVGWESLETAKAYISDESTLEKRDNFGIDL